MYRARCEVIVDGVGRLSQAVEAEVTVTAVLAPVADLSLTVHDTDPVTVDLTWTPPPAGRVALFRTPDGPRAGADATDLPRRCGGAGRPAIRTAAHPSDLASGSTSTAAARAVMAGVPWPRDWSRAYFTPVTLVGGRARLGNTTSTVRTAPIRDVELTEYCNKQVLTFGWPEGAAAVTVHLAGKGHDPRNGLTGRSYEITLEDYERYGGMQFTGSCLWAAARCTLRRWPSRRADACSARSPASPTTGCCGLWYSVQIGRDAGRHAGDRGTDGSGRGGRDGLTAVRTRAQSRSDSVECQRRSAGRCRTAQQPAASSPRRRPRRSGTRRSVPKAAARCGSAMSASAPDGSGCSPISATRGGCADWRCSTRRCRRCD